MFQRVFALGALVMPAIHMWKQVFQRQSTLSASSPSRTRLISQVGASDSGGVGHRESPHALHPPESPLPLRLGRGGRRRVPRRLWPLRTGTHLSPTQTPLSERCRGATVPKASNGDRGRHPKTQRDPDYVSKPVLRNNQLNSR